MMPSTVAAPIESPVMSASVKTAMMTSTRIVMVAMVVTVMRTAGIRPSQISGHPHPAVGPIKTPVAIPAETAQASCENCH
jgi:hypothetical protein